MQAALILLLGACGSDAADTAHAPSTIDSTPVALTDPFADGLVGDPRAGEARYPARCATCHGLNGEGNIGPALATVVPGLGDLELYRIITQGQEGMPAIAVSPQEGVHLVAYLQATYSGS